VFQHLKGPAMYKKILVPIDGSPTAANGLDEAIKVAQLTGASLRLIHVIELINFTTCIEPVGIYASEAIAVMTKAGAEILERGKFHAAAKGIGAETALLDNLSLRVSEQVIEQAKVWNADLIVIGTHGRRGVGRLMLGSDAEEIIRRAPVPVLLVRAPEAEAKQAGKRPVAETVPT
jgi:nucleotide-binding universal stress UspA family protein